MKAWDIWLAGRLIDTVYFTLGCTKEDVRDSLVRFDGYHRYIDVTLSNGC